MSRERNQAETFAAAVDHLLDQGAPPVVRSVDEPLLDLANRLRQTASPTMIDPRFRASLRQRLLQSEGMAELAAGAIRRAGYRHRAAAHCLSRPGDLRRQSGKR